MRRRLIVLTAAVALTVLVGRAEAQQKVLLFDMSKGQAEVPGLNLLETYTRLVGTVPGGVFRANTGELTASALQGVTALVVMTPFTPPQQPTSFSAAERVAIVEFVRRGGRVLLVAEEDRRMNIDAYGANEILRPFGLEFGDADTPVRNNVGAIGLQGEISPARRELPYSGGRPVHGGIPISVVNDEGGWVHMAYVKLPNGGRVMASGDAMAQFFLGSAEGQRLTGTGGARGDVVVGGAGRGAEAAAGRAGGAAPAAGPGGAGGRGFALTTRFWGKDSEVFMQEVIAWLLQ